MRVCFDCLRNHLVSDVVLAHRYGLNFREHVKAIVGKVWYFISRFTPALASRQLSWDPLDFVGPKGRFPTFYFWKPHLETALNLSWLQEEHLQRGRAASTLVAYMHRLLVHAHVHVQGKALSHVLRGGPHVVETLRRQLMGFKRLSQAKVPKAVVSRLGVVNMLRMGKLMQTKRTPVPQFSKTLRDTFDTWQDRLVETET